MFFLLNRKRNIISWLMRFRCRFFFFFASFKCIEHWLSVNPQLQQRFVFFLFCIFNLLFCSVEQQICNKSTKWIDFTVKFFENDNICKTIKWKIKSFFFLSNFNYRWYFERNFVFLSSFYSMQYRFCLFLVWTVRPYVLENSQENVKQFI